MMVLVVNGRLGHPDTCLDERGQAGAGVAEPTHVLAKDEYNPGKSRIPPGC